MRFLQKIKRVAMFDKVCNRWFGHVSRVPQEQLPNQTLYVKVNEKKGWLKNQGQDGLTISRILVGTG